MGEQTDADPVSGRTDRGLERLISFSDAVVAIAITLIVLPLVDSAREVSSRSTAEFLSDNSSALSAAGISFVVISSFWRHHHRLYERATGYTPLLMRVNMLWLAGIVIVPVATALDAYSRHGDRLAPGIYVTVIIVVMSLARLEEIILHRAGLLADLRMTTVLAAQWIPVGLTMVALIVTLSFPPAGLYSLLLLVLTAPLQGWVRRRTQSHAASD
ncbi:TMEM175 family protein [Nocardia sp. NPDC051570]|uniref:TMEM175 family protein n=1 Tax=Nocardia sp. NPDC051570 TaxID=3364324 RepID=UPI0037961500